MLVVDSGVWIDHFNGVDNPASLALAEALSEGEIQLLIPDLVLYEVLRGFRYEGDKRRALAAMSIYPGGELGGRDNALQAAAHYRQLRQMGQTVRSSIDALLASWCITHDHLLLQRDRDFLPYAQLGLRMWNGTAH